MSDIKSKDIDTKTVESLEHVEYAADLQDGVDRHLAVKFPPSLQGLSEAEIAEIDRKATRKMDILMIPTLMSLYVLNYLGELFSGPTDSR